MRAICSLISSRRDKLHLSRSPPFAQSVATGVSHRRWVFDKGRLPDSCAYAFRRIDSGETRTVLLPGV